MFEYKGNMHIHSNYSDGSGSVDEICTAAADAGLDFIILTDHFTLRALPEEGYRGKMLLLAGMEANEEKNHYLALDIEQVVDNNTEQPQKVIDSVNKQGGIGIIAHPLEFPSDFLNYGEVYNWEDWAVHDFQGIEIWNCLSQWKGSITNIAKAFYFAFNPDTALIGPYPQTLQIFDQYQQQGKRIVALGGSDAHAPQIKLGPLKINIVSYKFSFSSINIHILLPRPLCGELKTDRELIYNALRTGACWVANDFSKDSRGFSFELCKGDEIWTMGESAPWQENMEVKAATPAVAMVKLIKDGLPIATSEGTAHVFKIIEPGIYRTEVYFRHKYRLRPWIFSNSIWVI